MYKICVLGHFGISKSLLNGQTIKTKNIYNALKQEFNKQIILIDTYNWQRHKYALLFSCIKSAASCKNIIVMPAHNGLKVFIPLFVVLKFIFGFKLHYIVIGGWLSEFIKSHLWLLPFLHKISCIYVETDIMKNDLEHGNGLLNVVVMPNFKWLNILDKNKLSSNTNKKDIRFCTFSRVLKEKGIEDAINAVQKVELKLHGKFHCFLDIYGPVDLVYENKFTKLMNNVPGYIRYCGCVDSSQSIETLRKYDALLFPTYYAGEGMAGTIIDAYSAGLPVIASDWKYNKEFIKHGITGYIFKTRDISDFQCKLLDFIKLADKSAMRCACLKQARLYLPEQVIQVLLDKLD